jgi:hypothetical protein
MILSVVLTLSSTASLALSNMPVEVEMPDSPSPGLTTVRNRNYSINSKFFKLDASFEIKYIVK